MYIPNTIEHFQMSILPSSAGVPAPPTPKHVEPVLCTCLSLASRDVSSWD